MMVLTEGDIMLCRNCDTTDFRQHPKCMLVFPNFFLLDINSIFVTKLICKFYFGAIDSDLDRSHVQKTWCMWLIKEITILNYTDCTKDFT